MVKTGNIPITRLSLAALLFGTTSPLLGQLYQGPAQGTAPPGIVTRTTDFPATPPSARPAIPRPPLHSLALLPDPIGLRPPAAPPGTNEQQDPSGFLGPQAVAVAPGLLRSFKGIEQTPPVPPDPILAVGPGHLLALVNRDFAIFSKDGARLQQISAVAWFSNVVPDNNAFDPKVVYDHFADRWVMVWLAVDPDTLTPSSHILVAVSDDSDPEGDWCNFAFRGDLNGAEPAGSWSDFQGVGFDEAAVYVVPNQFSFTGGWSGVKLRILPKAQLYDPTCPSVTYTDLWDLRDPDFPDVRVATVRPAVTFGSPGVEYLINDSPFSTGTTMTLWSLASPLDPTPTLTAVNVPVTQRSSPPDADQLGGSTILVSVGGSRVRNLVYRNGSVWTAHSVADASGAYARARYVRIDVTGPTLLEDVAFGRDDCWLYYPAVTADASDNMTMVYNQSCTDEYIGIRYTGRRPADIGLRPSELLKGGEANYVKDLGSGRNRWGDYSGIAVDPVDPTRVWIYSEYAASPANTWGTWIGEVMARGRGDVNDDGDVNVGDVVVLVDIVLERVVPDLETAYVSDCNRDGDLDIGDVVCVIDVILGDTGALLAGQIARAERRLARARLSLAASSRKLDGWTALLEADLGAGTAGVQARIRFDPARVTVGQPELADRALGLEMAARERNGEWLILLYSTTGQSLPGGDGALLELPVEPLVKDARDDAPPPLELVELQVAWQGGKVQAAAIDIARLARLPGDFRLSNPYPNPMSAGQAARFELDIPEMMGPDLAGNGHRRIQTVLVIADVYNVRGQRIRRLLNAELSPGNHTLTWEGRNDRGELVGAGLYVLRLSAGPFSATRKLIVPGR